MPRDRGPFARLHRYARRAIMPAILHDNNTAQQPSQARERFNAYLAGAGQYWATGATDPRETAVGANPGAGLPDAADSAWTGRCARVPRRSPRSETFSPGWSRLGDQGGPGPGGRPRRRPCPCGPIWAPVGGSLGAAISGQNIGSAPRSSGIDQLSGGSSSPFVSLRILCNANDYSQWRTLTDSGEICGVATRIATPRASPGCFVARAPTGWYPQSSTERGQLGAGLGSVPVSAIASFDVLREEVPVGVRPEA